MSQIYNIPSSCCFVETLAQKLLNDCLENSLQLAQIIVLLPNRRSCRSLADAFVRLHGLNPTLLPQMKAIGDTDEDELLLNSPTDIDTIISLPPAISSLERNLLLTKLIIMRYHEFGLESASPAQSYELAEELGSLMDNVAMRELDWKNLQNIVPDEYATHWQETLKFLNIITDYWPKILHERNMIDNSIRRNILINQQCDLWQKNPPSNRIIIAGTTAVSPAMKHLVKTVMTLPYGEIYLAGLDKLLDEDSWSYIDETHPQYELKQLLEYLEISRSSVPDLLPPLLPSRERLISEIMRPASCSDQWRNLPPLDTEAIKGIHLMESDNTHEEAISIACLIRQTMETPEKTIALVTPDRNLARRVCSELSRWDITVDDSAGIPLNQTPWGIFIRLIAAIIIAPSAKHQILSLLKHPLLKKHQSTIALRKLAEKIDKNILRQKTDDDEAQRFFNDIQNEFASLKEFCTQPSVKFYDLLQKHIQLAETLNQDPNNNNQLSLWSGDDGKIGADFIAELLEKAEIIGEISPLDYAAVIEKLMSDIMVRNTARSHPRIKILGPMEARLNHYDTIIIGECNEGVWPQSPTVDPWMSRPMKRDFGLNQPEQAIGVTALDFSNLLGAKNVYLTRCKMNDGAQTVKSRWWLRLTTVLQSFKIDEKKLFDQQFIFFAKELLRPQSSASPITAPAPCPPLSARPRKLSASAFEKLLRDPYSVYAEYILKLKPLDKLDETVDQSDFGNLIHEILEKFSRAHPQHFPDNAREIMLTIAQQTIAEYDVPSDKLAFWLPKLHQIIDWIIAQEKIYRQYVTQIYSEVWGQMFVDNTAMGRFEIYAKADRIDRTATGTYNIIDYKSGHARSTKEVLAGYAPQLPIEALIAQSGGFNNIPAGQVDQLMYWKLGDKVISIDKEISRLLDTTYQHIIEIINHFAQPDSCYLSRPNPKHVPEYSDYEHLARVKEWSVTTEGDENC